MAPTPQLAEVSRAILESCEAQDAPPPASELHHDALARHRADPGVVRRQSEAEARLGEVRRLYDLQEELAGSQIASTQRAALIMRLVGLVEEATGPSIRKAVEAELGYRLFDDSPRIRKAALTAAMALGATALVEPIDTLLSGEDNAEVIALARSVRDWLRPAR